eukprot:TRINITY_DN662_c1_g1_i1.p1 TRINITY_DN662_c1_g1~~TRINITY_DN662_c1_g1_i1.p1  ORF type:complete len:413 (+),score=140.99 TRINITY_DN662_c1_g1_i1:43-1281(+)
MGAWWSVLSSPIKRFLTYTTRYLFTSLPPSNSTSTESNANAEVKKAPGKPRGRPKKSSNETVQKTSKKKVEKPKDKVEVEEEEEEEEEDLSSSGEKRNATSELVFFDIETTFVDREIIEFAAIVLHRSGLYELESFTTLVHSQKVSQASIDCNGITSSMLQNAPKFEAVADKIYSILNGRIWSGHNIVNFDNPVIKKEFEKIGREAPTPSFCVDTYPLLKKKFGTRAGNMKLASLGLYFGLGKETHRALEDIRMNIEVMKRASLTLLLEDSFNIDLTDESFKLPVETKTTKAKSSESKPSRSKKAAPKKQEQTTTTDKDKEKNEGNKTEEVFEKVQSKEEVVRILNKAMEEQKVLVLRYAKGGAPGAPRKFKPLRWVRGQEMFIAVCLQDNKEKNWLVERVIELKEDTENDK